ISGIVKHIVWDLGADHPDEIIPELKVKVVAEDGYAPTPTPQEPCLGALTVNHEGQLYNTVAIGSQCWFRENLNVGTMVNGSTNHTNNNVVEKYCYNNDASNCAIFGGLYLWGEAMNYSPSTSTGAQGLCPPGWHIPSNADWCELVTLLDPSVPNCFFTTLIVSYSAGWKLKETGTAYWYTNTNATNSSGFSARGGGQRRNFGGSYGYGFEYRYQNAYFWASSSNLSYYLNSEGRVTRGANTNVGTAYSIRCIRDSSW
ncbi:MAG TPA: fibrobacter succinogenes major paralogous domain-containing protein, partial [Bacteroidales bacterium]|nr:fibrobacter succinogenes major paralogous domain-containing protein [Bacteroidales bacterium]